MLNTSSCQGRASQNHSEILPVMAAMAKIKKTTIASADAGVGKLPSYCAGEETVQLLCKAA